MDRLFTEDSDDESEVKEWDSDNVSGRSGFIFLVDARKPMFFGDHESYVNRSFQCCLEAMLQIAREQRYDFVSIVLFGVGKSVGEYSPPPGVVLIQRLLTPAVSDISKVKSIIDGELKDILAYGHGSNVSIEKALAYCVKVFHNCRTKLYCRSILLFTNDDDPHKNDVKAAHAARKRAEEICLHQIELDVVGFGIFDSSIFYKELVLTARGELLKNWVGKDPIKTIEDVQKEIASISKTFNRHYGTFYLGEEAQLKLVFYKLYHEPKKLIWTSKNPEVQNQSVKKEEIDKDDALQTLAQNLLTSNEGRSSPTDIFEADTEEMPSRCLVEEVKKNTPPEKFPLIGGEYIPISKDELKWFETKVPRGLSLIGFKPLTSIPKQFVVGEPYFVLPDSRDKASERLFSHLLHACIRRSVAPVCWFSLTKSGNPASVVLYPTEPAEYAKDKIHPHGFHLLRIPFSDMIADYTDDSPEAEPSFSQIEAAIGIVKKTTISWYPDYFSDHEYKSRIAMVEALAMEYDDVAEVPDTTDIDLDDIAERLGELSYRFTNCSHLPAEALGKRTASNGEKAPRPKEPKLEDTTSLIAKVKAGEAHKLTVTQLRELLKVEGVKSLSAFPKPKLVAIANERFNV